MQTKFQIEKGVPAPKRPRQYGKRHPNGSIYPFSKMSVGDSFAVPLGGDTAHKVCDRIRAAGLRWAGRYGEGRQLVCASEGDNVRCWRVQ